MGKRITFIMVLIISASTGLIGLQAYWNYTAYRQSVKTFSSDINEALRQAIEKEEALKRQRLVKQYQKWLADTSLITITAKWNNHYKEELIYFADRHPAPPGRKFYNMGFSKIQTRTDSITPSMRAMFIKLFTEGTINEDLQKRIVMFYTQHLGDSLTKAVRREKISFKNLALLYKKELAGYDIENTFILNASSTKKSEDYPYQTKTFRVNHRNSFVPVSAGFNNPYMIILQRMKTVLISSLLLISITVFCFAYTMRTLLSQKKLADLKAGFINNMTHELKTPVATISIAAEAMQDFKLSKVSSDEYLSIIRQQAGSLSSLINQILDSLVNEQTSVAINAKNVLLTEILNSSIKQYHPQLSRRNMEVSLSAPSSVLVNGDPVHLGIVMSNLLDNAIKYGSEGSVIGIKMHADIRNALVEISNTGREIPEQYKDKIFDRFFRVPTGNVHDVKGYGLGLSYVRDILRQHKGTISVSSKESQTTFIISLPLAS